MNKLEKNLPHSCLMLIFQRQRERDIKDDKVIFWGQSKQLQFHSITPLLSEQWLPKEPHQVKTKGHLPFRPSWFSNWQTDITNTFTLPGAFPSCIHEQIITGSPTPKKTFENVSYLCSDLFFPLNYSTSSVIATSPVPPKSKIQSTKNPKAKYIPYSSSLDQHKLFSTSSQ